MLFNNDSFNYRDLPLDLLCLKDHLLLLLLPLLLLLLIFVTQRIKYHMILTGTLDLTQSQNRFINLIFCS